MKKKGLICVIMAMVMCFCASCKKDDNPSSGGEPALNYSQVSIPEAITSADTDMTKENAFILTDMMMDVTTGSEGTALAAKIKNIDTAGKTGTTSDSKDRWFTAYTPYYVGSVWVGYDMQKELNTNEFKKDFDEIKNRGAHVSEGYSIFC